MAALLLARLLTRPDMACALRAFMAWQAQALEDAGAGPASVSTCTSCSVTHTCALTLTRTGTTIDWPSN